MTVFTQPVPFTPVLTTNGQRVLEKRYLDRDEKGVKETPGGRFWKVAECVAKAWNYTSDSQRDEKTQQYYWLMASGVFMPNSPTLMNAGKGNGLQLSACYVLPVDDSMDGIFETVKRTALVHKSGGGTGFSFSRLRPSGDFVGTTGGVASGPVSFMEVINAATEQVKQGGTRRGANMGILRVDHPDILSFIHCKSDLRSHGLRALSEARRLGATDEVLAVIQSTLLEGQVSNFNISVALTDVFMDALKCNLKYDLVHPRTQEVTGQLSAREVWDELVRSAWSSGDPGLVFLDRINAGTANPVPEIGPVEATNPCGEQPLYPNEACNLGSINLAKFVQNGQINWSLLEWTTAAAVDFLDSVITVNPYPDQIIDDTVKANRRIGLGVMGWADMLISLKMAYDSEEAVALGSRVMEVINAAAQKESCRLGSLLGSYPNYSRSIHKDGPPRRNSTVTTIAPTGTISIIAGCSSGVEPLFGYVFDRAGSLDGTLALEVNEKFVETAKREGFWSEALAEKLYKNGTVRGIPEVPEEWQRVFASAHDITPEWHIRMQAAFQQHTENAVSKTINMTHDATVEDVERAYRMAYDMGCSGITVYRDGCKEGVLHIGVAQPVMAGGSGEDCPSCHSALARIEGCETCTNPSCGYSACSI